MSYYTEERKRNKIKLTEMIKKNPEVEELRIIALFSMQTGLSHTRIKEYIEELKIEKAI